MYIHTYIHTYVYMCIHTYIHTHTHTQDALRLIDILTPRDLPMSPFRHHLPATRLQTGHLLSGLSAVRGPDSVWQLSVWHVPPAQVLLLTSTFTTPMVNARGRS